MIQEKAERPQPPATQAPGLPGGPWPRTRAPGERHQAPEGKVPRAGFRDEFQVSAPDGRDLGIRAAKGKRRRRVASKSGIRHEGRRWGPRSPPRGHVSSGAWLRRDLPERGSRGKGTYLPAPPLAPPFSLRSASFSCSQSPKPSQTPRLSVCV